MPEWTRTPPTEPGLYVARPTQHDVIILPGRVGLPPMTNEEPQTFYVAYLKVDPKAGLHAFLPLVSIPVADLPVEWWGPMDDPVTLRWSKEAPKGPGWYWWKWNSQPEVLVQLGLFDTGSRLVLERIHEDGTWRPLDPSSLDEWAGPIEAPV